MMKCIKIIPVVLLSVFICYEGISAPFIQLDSARLANTKKAITDGVASESVLVAYKKMLNSANGQLKKEDPTVMNKTISPSSNDKHDYLSISRYWWPNPNTEDGFPWEKRDGDTNPDSKSDAVDRKRLQRMTTAVKNLSLAYYFTNDEKYAEKCISVIRTWFINESTLMNPHLKFAQSVPGNPKGRRSGILDGRVIALYVLDGLSIISESDHWTTEDDQQMNQWLQDYLTWLTDSELGKSGAQQENNHGSWYKFHVAALALYLGDRSTVIRMVELAQESLDEQLDDKGGQVHELKRTRSYFYSCFNLEALTCIATIGDKVGKDMWHYQSGNGKGLELAMSYIIPAAQGGEWIHPVKKDLESYAIIPLLGRVADKYEQGGYAQLLKDKLKAISENDTALKEERTAFQEQIFQRNETY